jgi:hypothetical protein
MAPDLPPNVVPIDHQVAVTSVGSAAHLAPPEAAFSRGRPGRVEPRSPSDGSPLVIQL